MPNLVLAFDHRPEFGDQAGGAEAHETIERLGPADGETLGTQRCADVRDREPGRRGAAEQQPLLRQPHRQRIVDLGRSPDQFDRPVAVDQHHAFAEGLRQVVQRQALRERVERDLTPAVELDRQHPGLQFGGLAVTGHSSHDTLVADEADRRVATLLVVASPHVDRCVVAVMSVAVDDGVHRRVRQLAQPGDHAVGVHRPARVDDDDTGVGLDGERVALTWQDVHPVDQCLSGQLARQDPPALLRHGHSPSKIAVHILSHRPAANPANTTRALA